MKNWGIEKFLIMYRGLIQHEHNFAVNIKIMTIWNQ